MTLYLPFFDKGWHVLAFDTRKAKYRHTAGYSSSVTVYGTIYDADKVFQIEQGARLWIAKKYGEAMKHSVDMDAIMQ